MPETIVLVGEQSPNIDTVCYRGSAPLSVLARLSQVDMFDQESNPDGLQRDLNRPHASAAYNYAAREPVRERPRAFPELFFNVRDRGVVAIETTEVQVGERALVVGSLTFDMDKIGAARSVKVSRLDGNHRVWFGNGDGKQRPALDTLVPFSVIVGLSRDAEKSLFLDVNAEQKGLNVSHLSYMRSALTPEDVEWQSHPARVLTKRLVVDTGSPWYGLVHLGGSKAGAREAGKRYPVTFNALEGAVKRLLRADLLAQQLGDPDGQYAVVKKFWQAVAQTWPEAWEKPADYYVLKTVGLAGISTFGARVIDRAMLTMNVEVADMAADLALAKDSFDWSTKAEIGKGLAGMSGNRAALDIAGKMAKSLPKPKAA